MTDAVEVSREALRYLLDVLGGNRWIKPIGRTVESADGTRQEERYPVRRADSMIDVPAPELSPFRFRSLSPCPCPGDETPIDVEMRLYSCLLQCKDGRRDADGNRILSYEIRVWAGQCPGCGTILWREYVPREPSDAEAVPA